MKQESLAFRRERFKNAKSTSLFLALGVVFTFCDLLPLAAYAGWLGSIQILNALAPRLPFPRVVHWLHAMSFELLALLTVAALRLFPLKQTQLGNGRPILMVHGYANHGGVWILLKKRLEILGYGPIYTINLGHPFRSIYHYAEKVKMKAQEVASKTGRSDLILIGHSMGGLVSSLYATTLALPNTVTDVITIASPLSGTPMAKIAIGLNAREMELNSEFTQKLRQAISANKEIRFHHIATKSDQVVIPGISAVIPDHKNLILEDLGHVGILYSQRVVDQIHKWLASSLADTGTIANDCDLDPKITRV
jgi:triacylglycerol esterase/lipase EstA (alpha/beta hydrolase family)